MLKNNMGYKIDNDILMYAIKNIIYPNIFIKNKYITRYKDGILISSININANTVKSKIVRYNNDMLIKSIDDNATKAANAINADSKATSNTEKAINTKGIQKILDKIDIDLNNINKTTIALYLNITAEHFKTLINFILKSQPVNVGVDLNDTFEKNIHFISNCLYKQGILIKGTDIPSYIDNNNEYIGYINMFTENSENDNTYIQYKENDKKATNICNQNEYLKMIDEKQVKKIRESIKLFNTTTQKEENVKPISKYMTEFFNSRIYTNVYIPCDMTKEKTSWGIILRSKNKYILKIFTTGSGKKTGRVCETYTDEDHNVIINQLIIGDNDVKMKNKKVLCSHIANILLDKNKLILYPLYKPKE
jgi:hypothetical protein